MRPSKIKKLSPAEIASFKAKVQASIAKSQNQVQAWPNSRCGTSSLTDCMREECLLTHFDVMGNSEHDEKPMMFESPAVDAGERRPHATRPFVPEVNPACAEPVAPQCEPGAGEPREGIPRWIELIAMPRLLAPPRRQWPQACFEASPRAVSRTADHRAPQARRPERPKSAAAHPSMANRQHREDAAFNTECTAGRISGTKSRSSSIGVCLQGARTMETTTRVPKSVSPEMHLTRPASAPRASGRGRPSCGQACAEPSASSYSSAQVQTRCETSDQRASSIPQAGLRTLGKGRDGTMSAAPTVAHEPSTEKAEFTRGGATKRRPKSASMVGQKSKSMFFETAPVTPLVTGSLPKAISKSASASNLYAAAPGQHAHVGKHNPHSVPRRRECEKQRNCCQTVKAPPGAKQQDRRRSRRRCGRQRGPDPPLITSKGLSPPDGAVSNQRARAALLAADRVLAEGRGGQ